MLRASCNVDIRLNAASGDRGVDSDETFALREFKVEPIAIIGLGCRFPGANDPESFWRLLHNGVDAITEVPKERWDVDSLYDPEPATPGKMNTRWGGFLEQVDRFDPSFFGISPREAERMDPQQRLVLEVTWESLEDASIVPSKLSGTQTGVFMGIGNYDYGRLLAQDLTDISAYDGTGNTLCIAANRLSYWLNLQGPSVVIETACSSSLAALHFACQSLLLKETNLCLVGGVSLMLSPEPTINYSQARMMAADGRCKTFDARADGYVRGEGCGVVVLKRLSEALQDGDNIRAVIRGSAVNQDGLSNGLTAPNGPAQERVIRQALKNAGVAPAQISYVEAHGTGTSLGDPIEVESLQAVLMEGRNPAQPCWVGSVKTNIGHLEAAAGMAGLIKVVLSLQHQEIPPHLHLEQVNPYISLAGMPITIPTQNQPWSCSGRLAGISAFGFGGTNCHAILEEAPKEDGRRGKPLSRFPQRAQAHREETVDRPLHLLTLSAKSGEALRELASKYEDFLTSQREVSLADVCFSANTGRTSFSHRIAVVARSLTQMRSSLDAFAAGEAIADLVKGQVTSKKRPKVAFLFTGQGSQYIGMGEQLYQTQPTFREALDRCAKILQPYLDKPLLEVLYPKLENGSTHASTLLNETAYTQPALFALEYALFELWLSWGIQPTAVMGHSVGELVAACVAGVFSLEDGLKLIAERGRLMQALPADGDMVAVLASLSHVLEVIKTDASEVAIAAVNGPQSVVISGKHDSLEAVVASFKAQGIKTKRLNVSHAFHSPLMEPMLSAFERVAAEVTYSLPRLKLISNLTGEVATDEISTPQYWCRHIRQPVRFAASMETLHQQGYQVFVEIGPKPILLGMARQCLEPLEGGSVWLPSLRPGVADWQILLESLAQLYVRGVSVDWSAFDQGYSRHRVDLPTYPFQRQRYWVERNGHQANLSNSAHRSAAGNSGGGIEQAQAAIANLLDLEKTGDFSPAEVKLLPKLLEVLAKQNQQQLLAASIKDWFYEVEWQSSPRQKSAIFHSEPGSWLIFADQKGVGQALAKLLQEQRCCYLAYAGETYQLQEPGIWSLNPANPQDFERLFQALPGSAPSRVVYLWSLDTERSEELTFSSLEQAQTWSCGSVLHLVQTLLQHKLTSRLWLVTRGAVPVGTRLPQVAQAPAWGLGKVVALEHPELWGGMLDLAPESPPHEAEQLLTEINDSQEDQLAFREGQRYVARLVRRQAPKSQAVKLQSESTYLITGGLGALGLKVAGWLVERGAKYLVLTSRRGASPQAQETISKLELSAKVLVVRADVSAQEDMVRLFETVETSLPPLKGIIHAAGVSDYRAIAEIKPEILEAVLRPKVLGTWILHQLTQAMKLDFFVCFSSISSVWGSKGQAHYAAANRFLDVLAHYRQGLGLPALSVNWGPWAGGGMALAEFQELLSRMGVTGLQPKGAIAALESLLGAGCTQATVANVDWSVFKELYEARGSRPLLEQIEAQTQPQTQAQPSEILQQLEATPERDRHSLLSTYLQAEVAKVLKLPQLPDPHQGLFDQGLDSLMAIELVSLVRSQMQMELSMLEILQAHNITSLAALLLQSPDSSGDVAQNSLDLNEEASLDGSIYPQSTLVETRPASIFLTGATGFLGAFLLAELLKQTEADIYCLVRAADEASGNLKLQQNLQSYCLWKEEYCSRIVAIVGNLSQPRLGLDSEQFAKLATQIDVIYHNGAVLNFVYPYSALKTTNVLGTQEILRLACQSKVKPLHYVSTDAVFDSSAYYDKEVKESEPIVHTEGIDLGYTQSKWVAEKLVTIARDRGLPVSIYRPPLIAGDSQTGIWNTDDFTCRFLKGCIQMGSMPDMNCGITIVPVDYVSQAIVYLSRQKSPGLAFHLNNPHFSSWSFFVDWINSFGYLVREIPYPEWETQLINLDSKDNALSGLLPFFLRRWSKEQLTFAGLGQRRVKLNCQATVAMLAGSSIVCPSVDSQLLKTYFSYFVRRGFLKPPLT